MLDRRGNPVNWPSRGQSCPTRSFSDVGLLKSASILDHVAWMRTLAIPLCVTYSWLMRWKFFVLAKGRRICFGAHPSRSAKRETSDNCCGSTPSLPAILSIARTFVIFALSVRRLLPAIRRPTDGARLADMRDVVEEMEGKWSRI